MKNFRRTVAFVLALTMCIGLMTTAFASSFDDFSDADSVTYVEAMDVLVGIGVISGSDGALNPKDSFTREQAAKMIAYMLLGEDAAEDLSASGGSFTDVSASRWSAGYIEYLAGVGIINGVGNGQFNPTGYVTGYQFVKMLLCAIGYGAQNEFVGSYWEEYVDSYGERVGAFSGSNAESFSYAATREEAMLYAFNILTGASLVRYSAYAAEYYTIAPHSGIVDQTDSEFYLYTLGYQTFGLYATEEESDGETYRQWIAFDETISDSYTGSGTVSTTTLSYDESFYLYNLYEELNAEYEITSYTVDGYNQLSWLTDTTIHADNDELIGSNEAQTLIHVDAANNEVSIETYYTYLAYINYAYSTTLSLTVYLEDAAGYSGYQFEVTDGSAYYTGEYVLVTFDYSSDKVLSVANADHFSSIISVYGSDCIVANETYYDFSNTLCLNEASSQDDYTSTFGVYLNKVGYIVGIVLESYAEGTDATEETDGETEVTDSETENSDSETESTDNETEGTDNEADGTNDETESTDNETESTDNEADGTDGETETSNSESGSV